MRQLVLVTLGFAFFLGGALDNTHAGEPKKKEMAKDSLLTEIAGKTLEQWTKEIKHKDPGRSATAISMVMLFGPERAYQALPTILEHLSRHSSVTPMDVSIRVNAATAIGLIIGTAKEPESKHVRDAITILGRLLTDSQAIVKYRAVQALGRIGDEAKDRIPQVLPLMQDRTASEMRQAAAIALGQIAIDQDKGPALHVLQALFNGLNDTSAQVRLASIQSLTWLGAPGDPKAKAMLLKALEPVAFKDVEPTVQIWAHMALMSIEHKVEAIHMDPIVKMLQHGDLAVRVQATQAIGTIGPKAKTAIPFLVSGLADRDPNVTMVSIWALSRMEHNASTAIPMLQKIMADTEQPEPIQQAAKDAIKQITGKNK